MMKSFMDRVESLPNGKYVIAVSGGVDSMVLLDLLAKQENLMFIVAHFDHGIRTNSGEDRKFVEEVAQGYRLPFVYEEGKLGASASEAKAREARYAFLYSVMKNHKADAVITAHHEDDLIETAILNLVRGTAHRGLYALRNRDTIKRPLLKLSKPALVTYAKERGLAWREDETNMDTRYLRNYIRLNIVPKLSPSQRRKLLELITRTGSISRRLDETLKELIDQHISNSQLDRTWFISLPHSVAKEVMVGWLRQNGLTGFDRYMIERLVVGAKTFQANSKLDVYNKKVLVVHKRYLALDTLDR